MARLAVGGVWDLVPTFECSPTDVGATHRSAVHSAFVQGLGTHSKPTRASPSSFSWEKEKTLFDLLQLQEDSPQRNGFHRSESL